MPKAIAATSNPRPSATSQVFQAARFPNIEPILVPFPFDAAQRLFGFRIPFPAGRGEAFTSSTPQLLLCSTSATHRDVHESGAPPTPNPKAMNKYIAEFIGTFFLVLTVGCTIIPGAAGVIAPLAIGASLLGL